MSPPLLKAALVQYMPISGGFVPNVVTFQYNPEQVQHQLSQSRPPSDPGRPAANPLAVSGVPGEKFSFTIHVDANEDIASGSPAAATIAQKAGVGCRLAALEMMFYPSPAAAAGAAGALVGTVTAKNANPAGATTPPRAVPDSTVPLVILVWGPSRIVPVRLSELSITETYYDAQLNPTRAQLQVGLEVLTPAELASARADNKPLAQLASAAYAYTLGLRQTLAVTQLADTASTVLGMIPQ